MTRTVRDDELVLWEAYATSGEWGRPERAKIVFHCLTEPGRRARVAIRDADRSEVEEEIARLSDDELIALLQSADALS